MPQKIHKVKVIGRREFVRFPRLGIGPLEAKIDTGAYTSSLHVESIWLNYEHEKPVLYFTILFEELRNFRFEEFARKTIKNSFGEMEERYVIRTITNIGKKKILSTFSLSNRDTMRYPVLIGRRMLKGNFVIDPKQIHTGGLTLGKAVETWKQYVHATGNTDDAHSDFIIAH
jgi:hypothetical protein